MKLARVWVAAGVLALSHTCAWAYCSEPSAPYCATSYSAFDDEDSIERCRREMKNYQTEVENYTRCIASEIEHLQRKASQAVSDHDNAADNFNRRGRKY